MTYYEEIERYLEKWNNTGVEITIDDIYKDSIKFCINDLEVTEQVLDFIEEVLNFIDKKGGTLTNIFSFEVNRENNKELYSFYELDYKINVGEDVRSDDELNQIAEDNREERKYEEYKESKLEWISLIYLRIFLEKN